ncbi:hypothetical protein E8E15_003795 [Penicillium rubens]|uniref:Uncharacterized protein n=1 Tax=Penicillium chrysogenum TaxID=5076 RepID=A0ABQ8W3S9_PENCH|nr:uncharacterized protein N7489_006334 [Penicillium chrysogenum]XP_061070801.1 uncharacterized protein N7525_000455 [Penicillium rubens]KAF3014583.1 hypothetical protein E8E15_003795 [Penicillium rubens]KAJ5039805.1 hypothetical protein NUH16_009597 [Penicillium rubens]KAJ5236243.1 hypothetical protein N7489_006334 [Penicillium chrysogenum]KAJ5255147.1 hypothetical protein N7505_010298 [Penicillium chrysogenum]KAJ5842714.1 hypothetical protein N7525_000455 [Penicillium rubens]
MANEFQPSPLEVVAHNATVILSGVLLGAILAFVTSHLGWLRRYLRLNDRLINTLLPLGPQFFFFTLPLWFIVTIRPVTRISVFIVEYATALCKALASYVFPAAEGNIVESVEIPAQITTS